MRWREMIGRFMIGRYGNDQLNRMLLVLAFICILASNFGLTLILYMIGLACLIICYVRMFSRNHQARYKENAAYMKLIGKIKNIFRRNKQASSTHHIFTCPQCKQKIRIPKGKGMIMVRCPRCGNEFKKKS